jgi:hypothetical protein
VWLNAFHGFSPLCYLISSVLIVGGQFNGLG